MLGHTDITRVKTLQLFLKTSRTFTKLSFHFYRASSPSDNPTEYLSQKAKQHSSNFVSVIPFSPVLINFGYSFASLISRCGHYKCIAMIGRAKKFHAVGPRHTVQNPVSPNNNQNVHFLKESTRRKGCLLAHRVTGSM